MPDVEVTRIFHSSFPSSFNFSSAAPARNNARGLEQQQAWRFLITRSSDAAAQQQTYLHLPSCRVLISHSRDLLSPDVPCMVLQILSQQKLAGKLDVLQDDKLRSVFL